MKIPIREPSMIFNNIKNKILALVLFALYCISNRCFAENLDTQLSRAQITLGDSVVVTYVLNNNANNVAPDFSALQKDFRIINSEYGNATNMINGVTTTQIFWRFWLEPKKAGELIVPEINFGNDKSPARKLTVIPAQTNFTNAVSDKQNASVFVSGEISSTTPYVQSQVLYTFKLYFRTQISNARMELPQINDVTFFPVGNGQDYQTTINGKVYNVLEKNFAIFPNKSGTIKIPPVQLHALTFDKSASYTNDPFNFDEPKSITKATKDFNLSVRDVPPNYQGTIWLPAKNLSLTEQWSDNSRHWEAGTPVTRTITTTAQGLRADQLPEISIEKINGVNVYVDPPKRNNTIQNNMVVGTLEQKVTYIPNLSQSFTIPPLKINWWNTEKNTNAVAELNGTAIQVKGIISNTNPPANVLSHSSPMTNIFHANTQKAATVTYTFYRSIWFWIASILLAAWIVTLFFMLRKKSDPIGETQAIELSEKDFARACQSGDAKQAQQYLLLWAKKHWPDMPLNLATLRELINDVQFKQTLEELEHVLYGKKATKWHGEKLLAAFLRIKKLDNNFADTNTDRSKRLNSKLDPLPPLNPTH